LEIRNRIHQQHFAPKYTHGVQVRNISSVPDTIKIVEGVFIKLPMSSPMEFQ
jgi:hypothetical protein